MQDFKLTLPDFSGSPWQFIIDARSELKKVVWPNKRQVLNMTTVVLAVSAALGVLLGGSDYIFTQLLGLLFKN